MLGKKNNLASAVAESLHRNLFFYILALFNLLFLTYILTIACFNRLALDDYSFLGIMRDHGFSSPFTFWYAQYQGRFGPQFFINGVLTVYKVIPNLFFYTVLMSSLFIYAIYQILKFYLPLSGFLLLNYSIFLFGALLLTTFEFSTFYWLNVSTMYFGGVLFALIGVAFIVKQRDTLSHYFIIAFCFLYVGSSSEHAGIMGCFILALSVLAGFHKSGYNFKNFLSLVSHRKILVAFSFCFIAFIIMVAAPGNKIRMSAFQQVTDPGKILSISYNSSIDLLYHIFYKLPYTIALITPILLFGSLCKEKIELRRINISFLLLSCAFILCLLIFLSNVPAAYAMGTAGPLRSFVFISFFCVFTTFSLCFYIGYHYLSDSKILRGVSALSVLILGGFVFYSFRSELPLIKKYSQTDKARVALLNAYQEKQQTETVFLQPLFNPKYVTITDMFRILTRTAHLPSDVSSMPVFIGEIMPVSSWQNNHVKNGLGLNFEIALSPHEELSKAEMDSIKMHAEKSYETDKFKCYLLDNFIYYQIHTPSFEKLPSYIFCRLQPQYKAVLRKEEQKLIHDFMIAYYQVKYKGAVPGYENFIFIKKEITKFPIKKLETGFYDVTNGTVEFTHGLEIQFLH